MKLHHDTKIDIMRLPTGNSEEPFNLKVAQTIPLLKYEDLEHHNDIAVRTPTSLGFVFIHLIETLPDWGPIDQIRYLQ